MGTFGGAEAQPFKGRFVVGIEVGEVELSFIAGARGGWYAWLNFAGVPFWNNRAASFQ